jgi:hypothetical protein
MALLVYPEGIVNVETLYAEIHVLYAAASSLDEVNAASATVETLLSHVHTEVREALRPYLIDARRNTYSTDGAELRTAAEREIATAKSMAAGMHYLRVRQVA